MFLFCSPQVNPPYYVKLVELVPHPETAAAVMDTTHALMTKVQILRKRLHISGPCYARTCWTDFKRNQNNQWIKSTRKPNPML